MSVDALQLSTADFLQVAQNADNRTVRLSSSGSISNTRLPTFVSTNQRTIDSFVKALRRDFGSAIADAAKEQLKGLTSAGTLPLKGFMVREAIDKAVATMQANINARDRFFSGIDPAHSFKTLINKQLDKCGITDVTLRAIACDRAEKELRSMVSVTGSERVDNQHMEQLFNMLEALQTINHMRDSSFVERDLPGSIADKFDLVHTFKDSTLATRAIEVLPLCRQIQPEGQLTRETVWTALTGLPMPQQAEKEEIFVFSQMLEEAIEDNQVTAGLCNKDQAKKAFTALGLRFNNAIDIAKTNRAITLADYLRPESILSKCVQIVKKDLLANTQENVLRKVAHDICRMGEKNRLGQPATTDILLHLPDGIYRVKGGKSAGAGGPKDGAFRFSTDLEEKQYRGGNLSEYTTNLADKCNTLCRGNRTQSTALLALFCQTPLKVFAGTGGMCGTGKLIPTLSEHMATHYEAKFDDNHGLVKFSITTNDVPELAGKGTMIISVSSSGEYQSDDVDVTFPTVPKATA